MTDSRCAAGIRRSCLVHAVAAQVNGDDVSCSVNILQMHLMNRIESKKEQSRRNGKHLHVSLKTLTRFHFSFPGLH